MSGKANVGGITALRGLASFIVVFAHSIIYTKSLPYFNNIDVDYYLMYGGAFGVDIFFVLSGYILLYASDVRQKSVKEFFVGRFVRIFPTYIVVLIVAILLAILKGKNSEYAHGYLDYIYEITLTSSVFKSIDLKSYVGVAWTLTYEFVFYMALALAYNFSIHRKTIFCFLFFTFIILASRFFEFESYFFKNTIFYEFVLGMICYIVQKDYVSIFSLIRKYSLQIFFVLMFFVMVSGWIGFEIKSDNYRFFVLGVPATLLLIYFSKSNAGGILIYLGRISYSLYLVHFVVAIPFVGFFIRAAGLSMIGSSYEFIVVSMACIILSLLSGLLLYKTVEERFS